MDSVVALKVDKYFKQFKHQVFKKGEILIRADENPQGVFYLSKGSVKEYAISHNGNEVVVNIFKPPAFFPMSWAINQTPNKYYFEALEEVQGWRAPREEVIAFIQTNPDVLYDLLSRVYKGTDGLLTRMAYMMSGEAFERVIMEILITAKRFGIQSKRGVETKISEKELANQTGMARETISRVIKVLKDKGLVTLLQNKLLVKDLDLLEHELAES